MIFIKYLVAPGLADFKIILERLDQIPNLDPETRKLRGEMLDQAVKHMKSTQESPSQSKSHNDKGCKSKE